MKSQMRSTINRVKKLYHLVNVSLFSCTRIIHVLKSKTEPYFGTVFMPLNDLFDNSVNGFDKLIMHLMHSNDRPVATISL